MQFPHTGNVLESTFILQGKKAKHLGQLNILQKIYNSVRELWYCSVKCVLVVLAETPL